MNNRFYTAATDMAITLVCGALLLTVAGGLVMRRANTESAAPHIVIDAGHGGEDGGAVAADGTQEKTLNLAISRSLCDMLTVMGFTTEMTRTDDTMLNAVGDTLRERKVSDTRNRLARIQQADIAVSIHQNKFPQTQYYGTQVFYSANTPESRVLAESVREQVVSLLQPNNKRECKAGDSGIYLLHHASRPMVLVECGFLSNQAELEKLKDGTYQSQLAFAVAAGVMTYF